MHIKDSLGENLSLYLLIGVWFIINFVIHIYIKFDRLKYFNQVLSLEYVRQIG